MSTKKIRLRHKKERSVISDTLPYEVPITFSNKAFYNFLTSNEVEFTGDEFIWRKEDLALDEIIKLLLGIEQRTITTTSKLIKNGRETTYSIVKINSGSDLIAIQFKYKISHKESDHRELSICHPKNQISLINFYNTYKESILYYCNLSNFSIRKPSKLANYIYHKDRTHYELLSEDSSGIEENDFEYENIRSFFVYKEFSNIHKFYESRRYHRCEKKFNQLARVDITKCFDSIYTHTLAWSVLGKEVVKENIEKSKKTFPGQFDQFMQQLNYNETNGIVIGPEFSRIFAEIILQSADTKIESSLQQKYNLRNKKNYQLFRYVDDYFIFFNNTEDKEKIIEQIQIELHNYNLYLNSAKEVTYEKPIITEITIAKQLISKLMNDKLQYETEDIEQVSGGSPTKKERKGQIYVNSKNIIIQFKTILKNSDVQYKDILNYTLSIIESKSDTILKTHHSVTKEHRSEKQLFNAIRGILEFTFFIYSVSPRVNTTIKLTRVLRIYISYLQGKDINRDFKHIIFKDIYDNLFFVLDKNANGEYTQVETLYLLVTLAELGKDYWIDQRSLADFFGIKINDQGSYYCSYPLNYFSLTVLLFYMKQKVRYNQIRALIEKEILSRIEKNNIGLRKDTELTLLMLDTVACPYIHVETKHKILELYGISEHSTREAILSKHFKWFTKWDKFNLGQALDAKKSREVY